MVKKAKTSSKVRAQRTLTRGSKRPSEIVKNTRKPLWLHQAQTKALYKKTDIVYDLSDPGTGKTRAHLEAFAERRRKGGGCALVVAPKSLLETAWWADAWEFVKDMRCSVSYASNRDRSFSVDADIYIINTDGVKWLKSNFKPAFWKKFDTILIDEISYFKHSTSQRSKAAKFISKFFTHRAGLTGTPNPKSVTELWHQVFLLDDGERLGTSFYKFRTATQQAKQIGPQPQHVKWEDKDGAELAVFGLLQDITIRHLFEECMDIPPNTERHIGFTLSPKLLRQYKTLEAATVLQLENEAVVALNAAVLRTKLLQLCLAEGTEVLTDTGWTEIQDLQSTHLIWDGSKYVNYDRLLDNGYKKTINCWGVQMTPDHKVLAKNGWKTAGEINGKPSHRFGRSDFQLPNSLKKTWFKTLWYKIHNFIRPNNSIQVAERKMVRTYDLQNVGNKNQFVIRNKEGFEFIVHNCSGAIYHSEGEYTVLDTSRYELITDLVEEHKHSVVFYNWLHQKEQLITMARKRGIECEFLDSKVPAKTKVAIVKDYQAGNLQAIYLHPMTGAHGLTLTRGTRTIWSSPTYQPDFLKQGKHRIYRGGQTKKTETIMIEAKGTVEKKVFEILNRDNAKMQDFLSVVHAAKETYD